MQLSKRVVTATLASMLVLGVGGGVAYGQPTGGFDTSVVAKKLGTSNKKKDKSEESTSSNTPSTTSTSTSKYLSVTEAPDYAYELTEVESFTGERNDITFNKGAAIEVDGDEYYLIGAEGTRLVDDPVRYAEYLGNGLYVASLDNDDVNNTGLVTADGDVLIDFDAAIITPDDERGEDIHFLKVSYATEETEDKDECFIYSTDRQFAFGPEIGDTMYKGYAEVFSVDKGKMVKGLRIENPSINAVRDLGDSFTYNDGDGYTMYDASGKELWSGEYATIFEGGLIEHGNNGNSWIIDATGEKRFETGGSLYNLTAGGTDSMSEYFTLTEDDQRTVVDIDGNQVLAKSYKQINYAAGGLFEVGSGSKEKIVNGDGKTVLKHTTSSIEEIVPGYVRARANNEDVLLKSGKKIANGSQGYYSDLVVQDEDNTNLYLVLNDEEFSLELTSGTALIPGLLRGRPADTSNYDYALYDLFTGEEVLEAEYETIEFAGDHVYAYGDGVWTVYEVELIED